MLAQQLAGRVRHQQRFGRVGQLALRTGHRETARCPHRPAAGCPGSRTSRSRTAHPTHAGGVRAPQHQRQHAGQGQVHHGDQELSRHDVHRVRAAGFRAVIAFRGLSATGGFVIAGAWADAGFASTGWRGRRSRASFSNVRPRLASSSSGVCSPILATDSAMLPAAWSASSARPLHTAASSPPAIRRRARVSRRPPSVLPVARCHAGCHGSRVGTSSTRDSPERADRSTLRE